MTTFDPSPEMRKLGGQLGDRLRRAAALSQELASSIQSWLATQPLQVRAVIAEDRLSWELRMEVRQPPPFADWAARFGDAVHNLRAVLDNLTWGLATLDGTQPTKPTRVQFPIAVSRADWSRESLRIAELPSAARSAIELIQPFQRSGPDETPETDALILLHRLSNVEKHRLAFQPQITPLELSHGFGVDFGSEEAAAKNVPPDVTLDLDVFLDGTALVRQVTKTPIVKVKGQYDFKAQVVVTDLSAGPLGVTTVIGDLGRYVGQVVNHVLSAVDAATSGPEHADPRAPLAEPRQ